ncbi:hypothetical protein [Ferrovibrio sp.]|uniref:hypothetical protein n=1 Tax=Ferrovibrio sp. TaxID=1917215 RepID=UPI0035B28DCE
MAPRSGPALLVLIILGVKLALLAVYGPTQAPDSGGYVSYADTLLAGRPASLAMHSFSDAQVFRAVGYPAVIAAAKLLVAEAWPWLVVALQIGLTLVVALLIHHLLVRQTGRQIWGLAGGLAYSFSLPLVLDQMILTDSLAGSLLGIAACLLAGRIADRRRLGLLAACGVGALLALAFLVREATVYLAGAGILPLVIAAAYADRLPLRQAGALRGQVLRRSAVAVMVILPMLASFQAYRLWNQARLGVPFVTTAAQTTMLQAMATVARKHPDIFDRTHLIDRVAAETFSTYDFIEVWYVNRRLGAEHGMTSDRIAAAAYDSYFRAWRRVPLQMLEIPLGYLRGSFAQAWFQPVRSLLLLEVWAREREQEISLRREIAAGRWTLAPVYLVDLLSRAIAVSVFAAFLLGAPWRLLRQGCTPEAVAGMGFWALFVALYAGYAMVHLESRYILGVMPGVTIVGLLNTITAWRWLAARRTGSAARGG